jgi:hypothetical protein
MQTWAQQPSVAEGALWECLLVELPCCLSANRFALATPGSRDVCLIVRLQEQNNISLMVRRRCAGSPQLQAGMLDVALKLEYASWQRRGRFR